MTQEDKDLLLKDLCARSPYGVKFRYKYIDCFFHEKYGTNTLNGVLPPYHIIHSTLVGEDYLQIEKDEIKPYLFPLSSMTEEQMEELEELCDMYTPDDDYHPYAYKGIKVLYKHVLDDNYEFNFKIDVIDWLNKNQFDYRGLIPKGLAIDATGKNIY